MLNIKWIDLCGRLSNNHLYAAGLTAHEPELAAVADAESFAHQVCYTLMLTEDNSKITEILTDAAVVAQYSLAKAQTNTLVGKMEWNSWKLFTMDIEELNLMYKEYLAENERRGTVV